MDAKTKKRVNELEAMLRTPLRFEEEEEGLVLVSPYIEEYFNLAFGLDLTLEFIDGWQEFWGGWGTAEISASHPLYDYLTKGAAANMTRQELAGAWLEVMGDQEQEETHFGKGGVPHTTGTAGLASFMYGQVEGDAFALERIQLLALRLEAVDRLVDLPLILLSPNEEGGPPTSGWMLDGGGRAAYFSNGDTYDIAFLPPEAQQKYYQALELQEGWEKTNSKRNALRRKLREREISLILAQGWPFEYLPDPEGGWSYERGNPPPMEVHAAWDKAAEDVDRTDPAAKKLIKQIERINDANIGYSTDDRKVLTDLARDYLAYHNSRLKDDGRVALVKAEPVIGYFTGPTSGVRDIRSAFGYLTIPEAEQRGNYFNLTYRYQDPLKGDKDIPFQLTLPDETLELWEITRGLEGVVKELEKVAFNPSGLKVLYGVFKLLHDNYRRYEVPFYTDPFLDALGFQRAKRDKQHQARSIDRVHHVLNVFEHIFVRGEVELGYGKGKRITEVREEPLITILGKRSIWEHDPGKSAATGKKLFDGATLRITPVVYSDVTRPLEVPGERRATRFTWYSDKWLQEDPRIKEHGYTVMLVPYYSDQWKMEWRKHSGTFRRNLGAVLRDAGIDYDQKNPGRFLDKIKREHDHMGEQGYIKDWKLEADKGGKPLQDILEVVAPPDYPLYRLMAQGRGPKKLHD